LPLLAQWKGERVGWFYTPPAWYPPAWYPDHPGRTTLEDEFGCGDHPGLTTLEEEFGCVDFKSAYGQHLAAEAARAHEAEMPQAERRRAEERAAVTPSK
jgi:hypothetical protein